MIQRNDTVGARLRQARTRAGLSLDLAAASLFLICWDLWEIEEGQASASAPGLLERAAALYGVPLGWLADGGALYEEEQAPAPPAAKGGGT